MRLDSAVDSSPEGHIMAHDHVEVFAVPDNGNLVVRINGRAVLLAFVDHDEPIPVKRHPDGTIGPTIEAEHYAVRVKVVVACFMRRTSSYEGSRSPP